MNREAAMKVANAVLYEGYILYPYRPSALKNRQRWSFGILYPPDYEEVGKGTERSQMHSEVLVRTQPFAKCGRTDVALHDAPLVLGIHFRFLHLVTRAVAKKTARGFEPVASLVTNGRLIESWDEAVERSVEFEVKLDEILIGENGAPQVQKFSFAAASEIEELRDATGAVFGEIRRNHREISGTISVSVTHAEVDVLKLIIDVSNTSLVTGEVRDRDSALLSSLLSAHTILTATSGEFVSLLDPPDELRTAAAACRNVGNFPVLVCDEGDRDTLLCSPIVLYDYPQIAPESAGDFYDATEMDEMLTLRVMTLTDDEKNQMRMADDRVRNLLQRTEQSAREQLMRTHGTIRSMRPVSDKS